MNLADLTYNEAGLIPCIVQDANTHEVLMMAWMNEEAVRRTLDEKTTWFWSRSRNKFWHKGEESGNTQKLVDLRYDCDEDTLLALVNPAGPATLGRVPASTVRSLSKSHGDGSTTS